MLDFEIDGGAYAECFRLSVDQEFEIIKHQQQIQSYLSGSAPAEEKAIQLGELLVQQRKFLMVAQNLNKYFMKKVGVG